MQSEYYVAFTRSTAIYPRQDVGREALPYLAMGLAGEAGEVANKIKKILRDDDGVFTHAKGEELMAELGDVAWYLARLTDEMGFTLEGVLAANMSKLESRSSRGELAGTGDDR